MNTLLKTLKSAEELIVAAQEKIDKVKVVKIRLELQPRLQSLVDRYNEVGTVLLESRLELLHLLVDACWRIGMRDRLIYQDARYKYELVQPEEGSSTRIYVTVKSGAKCEEFIAGSYDLAYFNSRATAYYELCSAMVALIIEFLEKIPTAHAEEVERINALTNKLQKHLGVASATL